MNKNKKQTEENFRGRAVHLHFWSVTVSNSREEEFVIRVIHEGIIYSSVHQNKIQSTLINDVKN